MHHVEGAAEGFGRASAFAAEELGFGVLAFRAALEHDFVNPFVGEVVAVKEANGEALAAEELFESDLGFVLEFAGGDFLEAVGADDVFEIFAFAVAEFVGVFGFPAHGVLDGFVELAEGRGLGKTDFAPDFWGNPIQEYLNDQVILFHGKDCGKEMGCRPDENFDATELHFCCNQVAFCYFAGS